MKKITKVILILFLPFFSSCKKFLEINPPKDVATFEQIFENDEIATSAITNIYSKMSTNGAFSGSEVSIAVLSGLSADELKSHNLSSEVFYKNEIPTSEAQISTLWSNAFFYIYTSNSILNGLTLPNKVSENTKKQLQGEAKFIRAFCYFYLVNLFGEVPLNLTADYRVNQIASKSSKDKIYDQITADLIDAQKLLPSNYVTAERIRPNKWTAKALLSRVYLYREKWELAASEATDIINQKPMYLLVDDLNKVFLKNSTESIWQLMPPTGNNTKEGSLFILTATPISVSLSPALIPLFEANDNRKNEWTREYNNATGKYFYPYKYKIRATVNGAINEYSTVIRLVELHLIRAEANAKLAKLNIALEDINLIRKRAGMATPIAGLNQSQCLDEVMKQRRFELFSEWGHRWLDLKRTGRATAVLAPIKGISWKNTDVLYPIPDAETSRNPNVSQNAGY